MRAICLLTVMPVVVSLYAGAPSARGELPPDQQVAYYIRESPADPESAVVFKVILKLSAQDYEQGSVGWHIDQIEFRQPSGETETVWTKDAPEVGSSDGLWWIQHANAETPQIQEFDEPPSLAGTASAQNPGGLDLGYDFIGVHANPVYNNFAVVTYTFIRQGDPEPTKKGEDEPVEIHDPKPVGHS